ncbi:MAG TPA: FoF1 ATP synthase subunit gamma [Silvibacterium sp.]|jgi:F-type H+-transporting ATPase subunit gamma|nr:FoF1 ATP synthase subunit gamma [Silvibacterium sp.]
MASILDLRRRIRSVKSTRQITRAMKMIAAAKLRRAQDRAINSRPYAAMLASVLESLKRRIEIYDPETGAVRHPLLRTREEKRVLVIVVSGDKGFAGAFNANIIKATLQFIDQNHNKQIDVEAIGRKGRDLFRRRYPVAKFAEQNGEERTPRPERQRVGRVEVIGDHPGLLDKVDFDRVSELGEEIVARYTHEEIDAAYIVYNEFKSVIAQRLVVERILPIIEFGKHEIVAAQDLSIEERVEAARAAMTAGVSILPGELEACIQQYEDEAKNFGTAEVDYIYEQSPQEIFDAILPRYLTSQLNHAFLESVAAEQAARMTAMDSATNNASEMIDKYTLAMNRARQAAITKEIIEIVSGAAAL